MTDNSELLAEMVRGGGIPWPEELEIQYPIRGHDYGIDLTEESRVRSGHSSVNPIVVQSRGETAELAIERWRRVILATLEAWPSKWVVWRIRPEIEQASNGEWIVYSRLALV